MLSFIPNVYRKEGFIIPNPYSMFSLLLRLHRYFVVQFVPFYLLVRIIWYKRLLN